MPTLELNKIGFFHLPTHSRDVIGIFLLISSEIDVKILAKRAISDMQYSVPTIAILNAKV